MARVRIKDVATAAGVSPATVSLVLNSRTEEISEATAQRVRDVAASLGYRPDLNARSLRTQRTGLIGVISDEVVTTPYAVQMIAGAQEAASARGYLLLIVNTSRDAAREAELISTLRDRRVDGYLFLTMYHREIQLPELLRSLPVVGVDVDLGPDVPSFVPDEAAGASAAARFMIANGHRRIAHLEGDALAPATRLRSDAFQRVLRESGVLDPDLIVPWENVDSSGESVVAERAMGRLLASNRRPTAVFAYNDRMAIGVYRAAAEHGIRVPEDLSVVGFDDQEIISAELRPPLTTLALPHAEMGREATDLLLDELEGQPSEPGPRLLPCPMIERASLVAVSNER